MSLLKLYEPFLDFNDDGKDEVVSHLPDGKPITKNLMAFLKIVKNFNLIGDNDSESEKEIYDNAGIVARFIQLMLQQDIHTFRLEEDVVGLLMKTDAKIEYAPLPFENIFIDADININADVGICGLFINHDFENKTLNFGGMVKIKRGDRFVHLPYANGIENDKTHIDLFSKITAELFPKELYETIANFVCCFIHFVNHPEVETINYAYKERAASTEEPHTYKVQDNFIRLTGDVKKYLDDLRQSFGGKIDFSCRYWVRGHFMNLKANRYKEKKSVWRMPHIRGRGTLIKKEYAIQTPKGVAA